MNQRSSVNQYYNPVRTLEGPGCVNQVESLLAEMELARRKVLLLAWSKAVFQIPAFVRLAAPKSGYAVRKLCFQASNPTVDQLFQTYRETRDFAPEVVIAVGGGSILDVGKSLCCLYGRQLEDSEALRQMIQNKDYGHPAARWIGVPTTAGTGSETTCWATIWDPARDAKRSMECRDNYAWAALVDPELAAGMPVPLAVSSALDAVAHAVESYWAKGTNCVSRALALQAVRTMMANMEGLLRGEPEAHEAMARGSMLAGLAFSNTKTTACHSISYPLTMRYRIPHGAAVSMLLAPVLRLNIPQIQGLPALLAALGVSGAEELGVRITDWLKRSGQPATLAGWGVKPEELPRLAQLGMTKGRADNNPVPIDADTIQGILQEIYSAHRISKGA